ncbi:MAG: response regulator [Acidiferrobacterales bacterium]|nr:response regulator [Acidiferrobacterales bacterium]
MKQTVLIVDDCASTLGILSSAFEQAGFTALISLDGTQAIKIADQMQPSVVILDAIMPGIDGFETCRQFKANRTIANIPIIFMTGLSDPENILLGFDVGGVDYVTKPVDHSELIARTKVHLATAQLTQSAHSALDASGQYMMAANSAGEILWMTPEVSNLFVEKEFLEIEKLLKFKLADWFAHKPTPGMSIVFETDKHALRLSLQGITINEEYLIRVLDNDNLHKQNAIKASFGLTNREAEVLLWITLAKTNREIAKILGSSPSTVNKHTEHIFKKLEVENRTAAAAKAINVLST